MHNRRLNGEVLITTALKFYKSGKEIQEGIKHRISDLSKESEELITKIQGICKVRDVDLQEVLDGADDEEAFSSYSNKLSSNTPMHTKNVLEALQKDLDTLRKSSNTVSENKRLAIHLERVSKNLDPASKNELTYNELIIFGF